MSLKLPIGIQHFENIRLNNYLYIDKTKQILNLIENGECYFLSRPRRFGKSLTLSTLEAMFKGKVELFKGLYAEEWVKEQSKHPSPVIKLDMSLLGDYTNKKELKSALIDYLGDIIDDYDLNIKLINNSGRLLVKIINELYKKNGSVVFLIDEYDKPITDNINNLEKAEEMRDTLRSFYSVLKGCSQLKFIMITGVSKFSKSGVFSCLNNLKDISMMEKYSDIVGYTQQELEDNFGDWIETNSQKMSLNREELLEKIKKYYDGFSFDGITRVYNPFSVLNFFDEGNFYNYWYDSATPSFLAKYLQSHKIKDQKEFIHKKVSINFTNSKEIENTSVESFLYQAGYLTISEKKGNMIILDYPNEEVSISMTQLILDNFYKITDYMGLGYELWEATKNADIKKIVDIFNEALKPIPYDDYPNRGEFWYRSLFMMLLYATRLLSFPEPHTFDGRPDIVIPYDDCIIILEFKFAENEKEVDKKRAEGQDQVKRYADSYANFKKKIITAVFVANDEKRQITL